MKAHLNTPVTLRITALVTATSLALLAACSDKKADASIASNKNNPAATAAPSPKAEQKRNEEGNTHAKMQAYIECYNSADRSGHRTAERYASWVNIKSGPTGKERHVYGLYKIHENVTQLCQEKISAALKMQPALTAIDTAARAYLEALLQLAERTNEADKYYERKDYQDDSFAKAKQMHAPLVQAMDKFAAASEAFSAVIETENDKLLAEELKQVEQTEGRKLRYWRMVTMAEAKQLTDITAKDAFDVNQAAAKLADFEQAADGLAAYAKEHKDELPTTWSFMDSAVEDFRIAAKARIRRVRDKKPYTQTERNWVGTSSGWMVEGSPDKLVREYNELVSRSNSTR